MSTVPTDEQAARNVAANLKDILDERQISRRQLARLTGDDHMTINRLCTAETQPTIGVLTRVADALQTSIDRLTAPPREEISAHRA